MKVYKTKRLCATLHVIWLLHENASHCSKISKKNDLKILWHYQMIFMPFLGSQTFKVKSFSENSLWSSNLNHLQTKVTPKNPDSCIFFFSIYNPKGMIVLTNFSFLSFRLADDQKPFNVACKNIILHFCAVILNFFILKC